MFFVRVTFPTINLMPIIRLLNTSPELTPIHPPSSSSFRSLLKHIFTLCAALSQKTILSLSECDSLSFRILYQHDPFFLSGAILQRHFRMKRHKSTPHGWTRHAFPYQQFDYTWALLNVSSWRIRQHNINRLLRQQWTSVILNTKNAASCIYFKNLNKFI